MNSQSMGWQEQVLARLQAGELSLEEAEQLLMSDTGVTAPMTPTPHQPINDTDIAIIGIGCRFPDANHWRALWRNLQQGVDSIRDVPEGRWPADERWFHPDPTHSGTTHLRCGGFLEAVDRFDAPFFQILPAEAEAMDPQQRIFLEEAYHAIEDAGYAPEQLKGQTCGVFMGVAQSDYAKILADADRLSERVAAGGQDTSILVARIAYFLDLQGPALAINTACASGLTAIHIACESIRTGDSDLALAGGLWLALTPMSYSQINPLQILSSAGRCKTFTADADGFVPGEGCGVLLLKNAAKALQDGDHLYAIIKGSAISQNGSTNGINSPSMKAQVRLIRNLYEKLKIDPATIGYVEAHGTGTVLGDLIEVEALTETFSRFTARRQFCAIGSIKTNIGHTLFASGIAGVIKTALCLKYGKLVPSLHFDQPNPHIDFANSPFYVSTRCQEWEMTGEQPRRAAVNAFGMNGSNAHMVLESAPVSPLQRTPSERLWQLLVISAKSAEGLVAYAQHYQDFLNTYPDADIGRVCYTSRVGRSHFPHRLSIAARSINELQTRLTAWLAKQESPGVNHGIACHQGAEIEIEIGDDQQQMVENLGVRYVRGSLIDWADFDRDNKGSRVPLPTYPFQRQRYWVDAPRPKPGISALRPLIDKKIWLPRQKQTIFEKVFSTETLPFLADHHVYGEVVVPGACYLSLVLSGADLLFEGAPCVVEDVIFPQALALLPEETRTVQLIVDAQVDANGTSPFQLISFREAEAEAEPLLHASGRIARSRATMPSLSLAELQARCTTAVLPATHYERVAEMQIALGSTFRWFSGIWQGEMGEGLGQLMLFDDLTSVQGYPLFPSLLDACFQLVAAAMMGTDKQESQRTTHLPFALESLTLYGPTNHQNLWCHAQAMDENRWNIRLFNTNGQVVAQMTGFQMRAASFSAIQTGSLATRLRTDWLHTLRWEPLSLSADVDAASAPQCWLLVGEGQGLAVKMQEQLVATGAAVGLASAPTQDSALLGNLVAELTTRYGSLGVVYLSGVAEEVADDMTPQTTLDLCSGLLHLTQVLLNTSVAVHLWVVTQGCQTLNDELSEVSPAAGALWGLGRTLAQEQPQLHCVCIDIEPDADVDALAILLRHELLAGVDQDAAAHQIAYRHGTRYQAQVTPWQADEQSAAVGIASDASYLITGGLGRLGLQVAQQLVAEGARHLVLTGRRAITTEEQRTQVAQLTAAGATVQVIAADIGNAAEVKALLDACQTIAPLRGIVHAASLLDDGVVTQQTSTRFATVMQPKVAGTWHLHTLTQEMKLDFFVCFSSAASILGSPGQSNYAAANAFMDTLMQQRRQQGLTGLSINWGEWAEVGLAAHLQTRLQAQGMGMIPPQQGRALFHYLLQQPVAQIGVWPTQQHLPVKKAPVQRISLLEELTTLPANERRRRLEDYLRYEIAAVLGLRTDTAIDVRTRFFDFGMDSLLMIRLRNVLMEAIGQALPATLLFDYPTVETLTDYLSEKLVTEKQPDVAALPEITILPADWPPIVVEDPTVSQGSSVYKHKPSVTMQMYYEWYTVSLSKGEGAYLHIPIPLHIGANVDALALQQACQALVDRHQAFRSTFLQMDGVLTHYVHASRAVDFQHIDAQRYTDDALRQQIKASAAQPFDFAHDSLIRFRLFTRKQDATLLITFHHIIMDGGSLTNFFPELGSCYQAFAAGDNPSLPPVPLTLVAFNRWLQAVWESPAGEKLAAHWRWKTAGLLPLQSHIFDRQPTAGLSNAGKEHHFHFEPALYRSMVTLTERNELTINIICLAGFMLLLACYTEQDDVVVGSSSMNRFKTEFAHVIGCLANNPLIRVNIADDPTLATFVRRVRDAFFDTYTHQTYSWKFIKALLVEAGHEIQSVLFPFTYAFQHFEAVDRRVDHESHNHDPGHSHSANTRASDNSLLNARFESYEGQGLALRPEAWSYLGIELSVTGETIAGFAHYYSHLFDEATVARLMAQYQELLARIVADPTVRLSTLRSLN